MPLTIQNVIDYIDGVKIGNPYTDAQMLQWVNEVDGYIWRELYRYKSTSSVLRQTGVASYSLPAGVIFNDITNVYVDGGEIVRVNSGYLQTTGYFRGTDGKINIYPVPTANDVTAGLIIVYNTPFVRHVLVSEEVYADAPFEKMYFEYFMAKIDFIKEKYGPYNNDVDLFTATYTDYDNWWTTRNPCERSDLECEYPARDTIQRLLKKIKT